MRSHHRLLSLPGPNVLPVILAFLMALSLSACDQGTQNIDYTSGSSLTVNGPSSLTLPGDGSGVTGEYQVRAFTIKQDYSWSVSPNPQSSTRKRDGENLEVTFSESGSYEVTVTTTIDGREYSGTATTEVTAP